MALEQAITVRLVSELVPLENNSKIHTEEQVRNIADSIIKFGFKDPIGITEDDVVLEGNGRLEACKLLDMTEVPTIKLSMDNPELYAYVHNKATTDTGVDISGACELVAEADAEGLFSDLTGVSALDIAFYDVLNTDANVSPNVNITQSLSDNKRNQTDFVSAVGLKFKSMEDYDYFISFVGTVKQAFCINGETLGAGIISYLKGLES